LPNAQTRISLVQVDVLPGNFATIRGRRFQLQQFHFHTPSEHTLNGVRYPLEAHFVYRAKDGRLAVLGVMFREGEANPAFTEIMQRVVLHGKASLPRVVDHAAAESKPRVVCPAAAADSVGHADSRFPSLLHT
jgi:carbonic anhydrase